MPLNTVIFDMDGLLIDSEPLWKEAAEKVLSAWGLKLTDAEYDAATGLRTKEALQLWFSAREIDTELIKEAEEKITEKVIGLVQQKGKAMPGIDYIFNFFAERKFKTGLASSSPYSLIETVADLLQLRSKISTFTSASDLPYGKPHPQVYLNCANKLGSLPVQCLCFEDSFNGMLAAKAARMKCVVVPEARNLKNLCWHAADLKISSLTNFNNLLLQTL